MIDFLLSLIAISYLQGNVNKTYNPQEVVKYYLLIDESNSLYKCRKEIIELTNWILDTPKTRCMKLIMFGNKKLHKVLITRQNQDLRVIKKKDYKPYGNSPLFDAIKETVKDIEQSDKPIDELIIISDFNDQGSKSTKQEIDLLLSTCDFDIKKIKVGEVK